MTPVLRLIPNRRQASTIDRSPCCIAAKNFIRSFTGSVWIQGIDDLDPG
jgi:hypothetical protein